MGLMDRLRDRVMNWLQIDGRWSDTQARNRLSSMALNADYYYGHHRRQFKVRVNQADDNLAINYTKLLVNKGVAMLLGKGIEFDMPGEAEDESQVYIDAVYKANRKDILLQDAGQYGGMYGTVFIKILPDELEAEGLKLLPRLVTLNPLHWEIETEEEDIDKVIRYTGRFTIKGPDGNETARKSVIERELSPDGDVVRWWITDLWFVTGHWEPMNPPIEWPYPFPPIIHWKNLPNAGEVYGMPDIDANAIELQDRINFIASNISKIIRSHAHPKTWGRGTGEGTSGRVSWGADEIVTFRGDNALIQNLEMQSDLTSSINYMSILRQAFFDTTQTVDLATIKDKIGTLTNFGLRVLYMDMEAKLHSKQEVWGEALSDLNHRLLVLGGIADTDGGEVVWPDVLPVNEDEQVKADEFEMNSGLVSKQTISQRRGHDWEVEQKRMMDEKAQGDNVGAAILRAFSGGQ